MKRHDEFWSRRIRCPTLHLRDAICGVSSYCCGLHHDIARAPAAHRASETWGICLDGSDTLVAAQVYGGRYLNDEEITGMLIATLFAGQHTSSITSSWTGLTMIRDQVRDHIMTQHYQIRKHAHRVSCTHFQQKLRPSVASWKKLTMIGDHVRIRIVEPAVQQKSALTMKSAFPIIHSAFTPNASCMTCSPLHGQCLPCYGTRCGYCHLAPFSWHAPVSWAAATWRWELQPAGRVCMCLSMCL